MRTKDFIKTANKLASILGWRTAQQEITQALKTSPNTYVPTALNALTTNQLKPKAAERLKQILTNLARNHPTVRAALANQAINEGPQTRVAEEILEKAGQPIKKLKTLLNQAHTLTQQLKSLGAEDLANQIGKATQQATQATLAGTDITTETKKLQKTLQHAQTITQIAPTAHKLGLTLKQITEYLNHIQTNYPQPIYQATTQTLTNPPTDPQLLETLRKEIQNKKPAYKTHALQKHRTPKEVLVRTIKQPPKTNNKLAVQWDSEDLGNYVRSVAFSPQGDKIAVGGNFRKLIVFSSSGTKLWESEDLGGNVRSVAFSPDGTKIAVGVNKKIFVFSSSGQKLWEKDLYIFDEWDIAWSPQSDKLVTRKNGRRFIVFSSSGEVLWQKEFDWAVKGIAWSPQGNKLAVGIRWWKRKQSYGGKIVIYSSTGQKLSESSDIGTGVVSITWSPQYDKIAVRGDHNNRIVVLSSSGSILWKKDVGRKGYTEVESIAWSPHGNKLAVGLVVSNKVVVFSSSGSKLWESPDLGSGVNSVAWSPDGTKLAVGGFFRKIIIFSSSGSKLWESPDLGGWIESVAWSLQGDRIVARVNWNEYIGDKLTPRGKVIVFGYGMCAIIGGVLRYGLGVSSLVSVRGEISCQGLGHWILGECSVLESLDGVLGNITEYLCSGDYFGAAAAYLLGVELGLDEPGLWDVWRALTMGWEYELIELSKDLGEFVDKLGAEGLDRDVLLNWFADELLEGGSALEVAGRVRPVLGRLQEVLPRVEGVVGDERFRGFVRAVYRGGGGLEEFVEVLESGLRFLESPGEVLRGLVGVRGELVGGFRAGFFGGGVLRVCSDSSLGVVVEVLGLEGPGVRASVEGGRRASVEGGGCAEFPVRAAFEFAGEAPVRARLKVTVPGLGSFEEVLDLVARVAPGSGGALGARGGGGGVAESVAPSLAGYSALPSASFAVGKALLLGFRPPRVEPVRRGFRVGGLEVRGLVGVGGFAVTLLGVDEVGRSFVLKVPREVWESIVSGVTYSPSERGLRAFEREIAVLSSLKHPHIVVIGGGGVEGGVPFVVMEFCENGSLRGVLERMGRVPLREALLIGLQVADVLRYIHSRGVVHRDLKPENILFTREGILKVTDFNIAKVMRTVSPTTSRASPYTPGYAAPEQVLRGYGRSGPWSDVWALGVILYEMIAGEPPFDPWDYEEAIKEGPDLSKLPEGVRDLVASMLAEEPKERPSAEEVEEGLARVLRDLSL